MHLSGLEHLAYFALGYKFACCRFTCVAAEDFLIFFKKMHSFQSDFENLQSIGIHFQVTNKKIWRVHPYSVFC